MFDELIGCLEGPTLMAELGLEYRRVPKCASTILL